MIESGGYPVGTQYSRAAPWNTDDQPEKEFDITCCQVLSKNVPVFTSQYIVEYDDGLPYTNTSDTNWAEEYHDNDYHTPVQLIELFKQFLQEQLEHGLVFKTPKFTEKLIEECSNWIEDETEYIRE